MNLLKDACFLLGSLSQNDAQKKAIGQGEGNCLIPSRIAVLMPRGCRLLNICVVACMCYSSLSINTGMALIMAAMDKHRGDCKVVSKAMKVKILVLAEWSEDRWFTMLEEWSRHA